MHTSHQRLKLLSAFAAVAAIGSPAFAQSSGGASNLQGGNGFNCASGTYQVVNGMARCTQPAPYLAPAAGCSATVMPSGACSFSFPASTSRSVPVVANTTPGYTGTAQASCTSGVWSALIGPSCSANPCSATAHTYGACSFSVPALASGGASGMSNTTAGYTGSSTASCSLGTLSYSGESCAAVPPPTCPAGTLGWGTSCNASVGVTSNGGSPTLTNAVAGYTGSAQFTCNAGTWNGPYSSSCAAVPPPTCPSPAPAGSQTINGCAANQTGTVTQSRTTTCNAGTGWAWQVGAWTNVSNTCTTIIPGTTPSTTLVNGGDSGCDDTYTKTMTGTYTATTTWFRSPDGRGAHLGMFMTKRVQNWVFDGVNWNGQTPTTDTIVNKGMSAAAYCM
jgi:hypothetical protein